MAGALRGSGPAREPPAPTPRSLGTIEEELARAAGTERASSEALVLGERSVSQLDELLHAGVCPTCRQTVRSESFATHREEAAAHLAELRAAQQQASAARETLDEERKARERYERTHERWSESARRRQEADDAVRQRQEATSAADSAHTAALHEVEGAHAEQARLLPVEEQVRTRRHEVEAAETAARTAAEALERATREEERRKTAEAIAVRLAEERARLDADLAAASARHLARTERIAALRQALAATVSEVSALGVARAAEQTAERTLRELRESLVRTDSRIDGLLERQRLCERGRAERAARVTEADDLEEKADWAGDRFRTAVLRMEKELLAHAQLAFDRAFSRFFASLVDDPALTARTDASFTPEVTSGGEVTPAEALSGGERTSLALAFRLALADVVRSLGQVRLETLLLDEPTDGFSSEQVVRMGELLEELALPQVIVVSHESQLTGIADRTVRVLKVDGRSRLETDARAPGPAPDEPGPLAPASATPRSPGRRRTR